MPNDREIRLTSLGNWAARMGDQVLFRAPCHNCRQPVVVRPSGVYSVGGTNPNDAHRCERRALAA